VLHLVDGNGNYMDERMGDLASRTFSVVEGAVEVSGLKFAVVSSKNGNFFFIGADFFNSALTTFPKSVPQTQALCLCLCMCG
jgi:hypothetical protein